MVNAALARNVRGVAAAAASAAARATGGQASRSVAGRTLPAVASLALRRYASTAASTAQLMKQNAGRMGESPPYWLLATAAAALLAGGSGAAYAAGEDERTFIAIKPDGVNRGLVAEIIRRFETKGYKLVGIKVLVPSTELVQKHYAEHEGRPFYPGLCRFLTSGAVVAMVWEGKGVIKAGRGFIGATNPLASAPGTIRGDFGIDVGRNIVHGSDSPESAVREIGLWFKPEELAKYTMTSSAWIYE